MTAIHPTSPTTARRGVIYYDASCGLCSSGAVRMQQIYGKRGFAVAPLQDPGVAEMLGLPAGEIPEEMKVRTADGRVFGGVDALLYLARFVWWMLPLWVIAQVPRMHQVLDWGYRWIARHRHQLNQTCALEPPATRHAKTRFPWLDVMVATIPVAATLIFARPLPAWGYMWMLAWAVWMGCKWLTWRAETADIGGELPMSTMIGYFVLWPGMDARPFVRRGISAFASRWQWTEAIGITLFGALLVWIGARIVMPASELMAGWVGMVGSVLVLHFGLFRCLAYFWRAVGIMAEPLMNRPLHSESVADFWGRWNRGFRDFAFRLIFKPTRRRIGLFAATLATFVFSGLVHDLIISVPARAGYFLPTVYFTIQGFAVLFEKTAAMKRSPIWVKQGFTYAALVLPVPLLFHPPFVRVVYVPFLRAIGAL
jgi:alginate O-acetyltransferase complex protein AlgI